MKPLLISLVMFLALTGVALAHEVATASADQIGNVRAGVTPDSFLYRLDAAIDNIRYLLTFDSAAKAKVGLEIARERLLEVKEMIAKNKIEAAQKAQKEHAKTLEKVKSSITTLSRDNSTRELTETLELEKEIEEHEEEVNTISGELRIKIEVKGKITPEQQALIDSFLNLMQNKTSEAKVKIENKKDEVKAKIKIETGKSDEEIEDDIKNLERKTGLLDIKQTKAKEQIDDSLEEIAKVHSLLLQVNETQINITAAKILLSRAEDHLSRAQTTFNEAKFGEAFGLANSAERLAKSAEEILERLLKVKEVKREIEVEVEGGVAKIKVGINDFKLRYRLNTTNKDEIVSDIAAKTGLSIEEINSALEFKVKEAEKETELEAAVEEGIAKIKTKIGGIETKFVIPTENRSEIISKIAQRTGLEQAKVEEILKIEIEKSKSSKLGISSSEKSGESEKD
ncbi:MAG: DUF5667 domain-containing protein [Candidatus Aenigmatarchaeota archaeon]|nr:hypothetical protein [Candidatus Aenigmarchaeota archaeon]